MSKTMTLDVLTPEKKVCCLQADMVIARAIDGEIGILPGHAPLVVALDIAPVRVRLGEEETEIAVCNGFMEVLEDHITIMAPCAETPEDIDTRRAQAAKERAEELLRRHTPDVNIERAELALRRALTRLQVAEHIRR